MQKLVSIIVPVYKVEKYIYECVDSIINQDYKNIEILLVDDGSPDQCPQICDEYALKYSVIYSLHKLNGGLGDARNYGVQHARGEFVTFVDSDDKIEPQYVSNLVNLIEKFNADVATTRIRRESGNPEKKPSVKQEFDSYVLSGSEALFAMYNRKKLGWSAYGKIYKKELLINHPFPKGYYEDCAVMYKILNDSKAVAIGDYLYNYHYLAHEGSILNSSLRKEHFRIFEICEEFEKFINDNYPQYYIATILLKRTAVTQMHNCQQMSWRQYKEIFYKYRGLFRRNFKLLINDKRVSNTQRYYLFIYCTLPSVVYLNSKVIKLVK